jgi:hypothetical protein
MCRWYRVEETETAGGDPTVWALGNGGTLFMEAYVRISGPSDLLLPRRVVATGPTRASARASAVRALSRYDDTYQVVPRPDARV